MLTCSPVISVPRRPAMFAAALYLHRNWRCTARKWNCWAEVDLHRTSGRRQCWRWEVISSGRLRPPRARPVKVSGHGRVYVSQSSRHISRWWRCYYVKITSFWRMTSCWRYNDVILRYVFSGCPGLTAACIWLPPGMRKESVESFDVCGVYRPSFLVYLKMMCV